MKKTWSTAFIVFSTGKIRQGRINSLVLASLNTVNRLSSIRADLFAWHRPLDDEKYSLLSVRVRKRRVSD